jgi:CO dehydrogenase maturation factor
MKKIVVMGRGGTGKTSLVALISKYLIEIGETPLLLIDADPDQNLGDVVGAEVGRTISDILYEFMDEGGSITGASPLERLEPRILEKLYEGDYFDLIVIGAKWKEGCYCMPNNLLKKIIPTLAENYKYVLIDSPAGLEHLNRRITSDVDYIIDILDSSKKSFEHVNRAYRIIKEVKIKFKEFYLVGGNRFPNKLTKRAEDLGMKYLGKINYDENVESYIIEGKSLLELPQKSPAYLSIKGLMEKIL